MDEIPIDIDASSFAVSSLYLLNLARLNNFHCDFTIKLGDELLTVHKVVLATRSEYFESMFRSNTIENRKGLVEMKGVDFESVRKCIEYIYTGEASVKRENIEKLMHVSHMMMLRDLCSGIGSLLYVSLDHVTLFMTKRLADVYNVEDLEQKCDNFFCVNFEAVCAQEEFKILEKEYLAYLIRSGNITAAESAKLNAIIKWIHGNVNKRKKNLPEFIEMLDLTQIPKQDFKSLLENEPLIYEDASLLRKFSLAMINAPQQQLSQVYQPPKFQVYPQQQFRRLHGYSSVNQYKK